VLRKLGQARSLLASYERIRDQALDPKTSPELANTKSDLEAILEDLADLDDLDDSVTVVESEPSRFGLSVEEVRRRRGFVDQIKDQVEDLRFASTTAYQALRVPISFLALTLNFSPAQQIPYTQTPLMETMERQMKTKTTI
jgi:Syntaxin 6, N-terminal